MSVPVDVMLIPDISEEPNLAFWHKHRYAQSMDRSVAKPLIIEATPSIQPVEVFFIGYPSEEIEIADLKVRKELAVVVVAAIVGVEQPVKVGIRMDEFGVGVDERAGS